LAVISCACCRLSADEAVIKVESADADYTLTENDIRSLLSSQSDLVKKGGGRLIIDRSLEGYKGEIRVEEGYLLALHNKAFGDVDKGTVVKNGATLEFKHDTEALLFGKEQITVSGIGVNGCGALCHVGTVKDQWRAVFERIKLAGDTRFGGVITSSTSNKYRRWDIRGGQGILDMQGHNLEIVCRFGIASAGIVNPGNITVTGKDSAFCLEGSEAKLNGSAANTLTIGEGARLNSQRFAPAVEWSVVLDGCLCNEEICTGEYQTRGRINGPVTITEKGVQFNRSTSAAGAHWSFGGTVTANGEIFVGNYNVDLMVIQDLHDDLEDKVEVYNAMRKNVRSSQLDTLLRVRLFTSSGTKTEPQVYAKDFSAGKRMAVDLAGAAAIAFTGSLSDVFYRQLDGYASITGVDTVHKFKDLIVTGNSTLDLHDAGMVDVHTNAVNVGGVYPSVARLKIGGDTLFVTNWPGRVKGGSKTMNIGSSRDMSSDGYAISDYFGSRGVLEICDGAVITNLLWVGYASDSKSQNATCHGSVFMRGGSLTLASVSGEYINNYIASQGSGYMEVSGGSVRSRGSLYPASGKRARGLWYQKGGNTLIESSGMIFGQYSRSDYPSKGVYYQTGGTVTSWGGFIIGKTIFDSSNAGNQDQLTMAGGSLFIDNAMDLAGAPGAKAIVNLNGGVLQTMFMQVMTNENQTIINAGSDVPLDGTYAWINFDGGALKYHRVNKVTTRPAYKAESFFFGDPERMRLTSFREGAVLDTAGYSVNLDHTITAPSGKGLVSLALPENVTISDWMFVGAPYIEIEGDGVGASAVAEFDSVNGRVTGFTVTSPGNDYTEITAKLTRGGYTNEIPLVCTLGTVASGGLTKKGEGVLRLNAANTYGGVTRVEGGTLKAVHSDAVPANNGIEIVGGTLDAGGFEKSYGAISATSGTLQNAAGTFSSFVKTGEGAFMFNAPLSGTTPLEVREGTLRLPVAVPGLVCGEKIYESNESRDEYNKGVALSNLGVELEPSRAYLGSSSKYFSGSHYVSYSGYVWNRSATNETWTFAYSFDDFLYVYINGKKVESEKHGDGKWGTLHLAKATLTPGANAILIQLFNASGDGGAISANFVHDCVNWSNDIVGIAYNPNGGDSTDGLDYVHMTDPGDGSLFTVYPHDGSTMPSFESIRMWPGTTLDACGGIYAFGKELKVTEEVFANPIQVLGGIAFVAGSKVDVADLETLDRDQGAYTILETTHGVSGALPELDGAWRLRVSSDGRNLELLPRRGTAVVIR
ncbi:MAG: autotransporter-associated beta strand repeat-containing protein, partial [Kiritimatiellae bacterium]|nr:autotransporter-associated beta strand repeat-containing protein [Kiritimatiellia bacterium]